MKMLPCFSSAAQRGDGGKSSAGVQEEGLRGEQEEAAARSVTPLLLP